MTLTYVFNIKMLCYSSLLDLTLFIDSNLIIKAFKEDFLVDTLSGIRFNFIHTDVSLLMVTCV